jgi:uncharacterized protein (TIGR00369 family)
MNELKAREAFEHALGSHTPEFGKFFLARLFGLVVAYRDADGVAVGDDAAPEDVARIESSLVEMQVEEFMFNPQGGLHGGVTAMVMDISMGHLLNRVSGPGATLEIKVQYLKAAKLGRLSVTGRFIRRGRGLCFMRSEAVDATGNLIAFATSTWKVL